MAGERYERELARAFDDAGWIVMKSPASGSATKRPQPDLLAGNGKRQFAMELKVCDGERIYLDPEEIEQLEHVARGFGALPRVVARWKGDTTYYARAPEQLTRTEGGAYRYHRDDGGAAFPPGS